MFGWGMFLGNVMFERIEIFLGEFCCLDDNFKNFKNDGNYDVFSLENFK